MAIGRQYSSERAGVLLCHFLNHIVRNYASRLIAQSLIVASVAIPWFTLREVPVEVEIVGQT